MLDLHRWAARQLHTEYSRSSRTVRCRIVPSSGGSELLACMRDDVNALSAHLGSGSPRIQDASRNIEGIFLDSNRISIAAS